MENRNDAINEKIDPEYNNPDKGNDLANSTSDKGDIISTLPNKEKILLIKVSNTLAQ